MAQPFQYEPLQGNKWIRLLRVRRGSDLSIVGDLQHFCLSSGSCPRFTTVSYTWGKSTHTRDIILGNRTLSVLTIVYSLLEAVCDSGNRNIFTNDAWFWIDSICINQENVEEKGHQIPLMERIFGQSGRTLVWLGNGSAETDKAMDFLETLASEEDNIFHAYKTQGIRSVSPVVQDPGKWKALELLLENRWWRRVWTLQEFLIASHLDFVCGQKSITRSCFKRAVYAIWLCNPAGTLIRGSSWSEAWHRRRLHQWYLDENHWDKMSLIALMAYTGHYEVTDPRDRIYGLLGLASDSDVHMVGAATYTHRAGEIYTALVRAFIDTRRSLDVICFAPIFKGRGARYNEESELPSWVPDWRYQRETAVIPLLVSQSSGAHIGNFRPITSRDTASLKLSYHATKNEPPEVSCSEDSRRLTCKGIFLDYIDGLGHLDRAMYPRDDDESVRKMVQPKPTGNQVCADYAALNSPLPQASWNHSDLLDTVIRSVSVDRQDRYLTKQADIAEFREDLLQLTLMDPGQRENIPYMYSWVIRWYQNNKSLRINGFTLEDLCKQAVMPLSSIGEEPDTSLEGFAYRLHDVTNVRVMDRRLLTTEKGYVGMAPRQAQPGDLICVLYGCSTPVVLRRQSSETTETMYEFIGECYLDGFMSGEALDLDANAVNFVLF